MFRDEIVDAVNKRDFDRLRLLCANRIKATPQSVSDFDILKICSKIDDNLIDVLIGAGFDIDSSSKKGRTLLIDAAASGRSDLVKHLLDLGANPNAIEGGITTPLVAAAKTRSVDHVNSLKHLIQHGAEVNFVSGTESEPTGSALVDACWEGNVEGVKLLVRAGANVNHVTLLGTPLTTAVEYGHTHIVEYLLQVGADIESVLPNRPDRAGDLAGLNAIQIAKLKKKNNILTILNKHSEPAKSTNTEKTQNCIDFRQLFEFMNNNLQTLYSTLRPPAVAEDLLVLSAALQQQDVPPELIELLKLHNGQYDDSAHFIQSDGNIPEHFRMLSAQEIIKQWRHWSDLLNSNEFDHSPVLSDPGVVSSWYDSRWIPFTTSRYGDHHCIDCRPTSYGDIYQIIILWHDRPVRPVVSTTLLGFLTDEIDRTASER